MALSETGHLIPSTSLSLFSPLRNPRGSPRIEILRSEPPPSTLLHPQAWRFCRNVSCRFHHESLCHFKVNLPAVQPAAPSGEPAAVEDGDSEESESSEVDDVPDEHFWSIPLAEMSADSASLWLMEMQDLHFWGSLPPF